jgi:hypothetical protein
MRSLATGLSAFSPLSIVATVVLALVTLYLRALRWNAILPHVYGASRNNLFNAVVIGFMINNILPARLGELARAFILWRKNGYSASVSIGSLIVERIIDTVVILSFFTVPVILLPRLSDLHAAAWISGSIVAGTVLCAVVYVLFNGAIVALCSRLLDPLPEKFALKLRRIGKEVRSTLGWLRSPRQACVVIVLSLLTALCYPVMIIVLARHIIVGFGLVEGLFGQAFAAFGAAIPLAPGYVGTLHAVMLQGLTLLGMEENGARAVVIAYHILNYIPITLLGLILFFRTNISFKDLSRARDVIEQDVYRA